MTGRRVKEQEKMCQSVDRKRETKLAKVTVTVMFHDRKGSLGVISPSRARENAAPSLSGVLAVVFTFLSSVPSLPSHLNVSACSASLRHRTRRKSMMHTEKFCSEEPVAVSALAGLIASPNRRGAKAAENPITILTKQRCCAAA